MNLWILHPWYMNNSEYIKDSSFHRSKKDTSYFYLIAGTDWNKKSNDLTARKQGLILTKKITITIVEVLCHTKYIYATYKSSHHHVARPKQFRRALFILVLDIVFSIVTLHNTRKPLAFFKTILKSIQRGNHVKGKNKFETTETHIYFLSQIASSQHDLQVRNVWACYITHVTSKLMGKLFFIRKIFALRHRIIISMAATDALNPDNNCKILDRGIPTWPWVRLA